MKKYDLKIKKQYLNLKVNSFEKMYPFMEIREDRCQIKIGKGNELYKFTMLDLLHKECEGYIIEYELELKEHKNDEREVDRKKYCCPKCYNYMTNNGISHKKNCSFLNEKKKCFFTIYEYDEYENMKKERNIIDLEEEDKKKGKKNINKCKLTKKK